MHSVLITGGAGFIGSCLARQWLAVAEPVPLIVLDKLTYAGNLDSLQPVWDHPAFQFQQGDVADRELVGQLLRGQRVGAIVHLAAESHVDRSIDRPADFVETNIVGTFQLLEATLDYWHSLSAQDQQRFRLLHVSTDEVYGSCGPADEFHEQSPYAPSSPYAASKASADHLVRSYHRTYGLPAIISNCSNNYGPYQFPEKLIPLITLNALQGRPLPVYGDGRHVRDWLHAEDHCAGLRLVLERGIPGETYGFGGGCQRTNLQIVRHLCEAVDQLRPALPHTPCETLIRFVEDRPAHDRRYALDCSKAERELGWRRRWELETGLRATVAWYLEHAAWVERVSSGAYRYERLGLARVPRPLPSAKSDQA